MNNQVIFKGPMCNVKGIVRGKVIQENDPDKGKTFWHNPYEGDFEIISGMIRKDKPLILGGGIMVEVFKAA